MLEKYSQIDFPKYWVENKILLTILRGKSYNVLNCWHSRFAHYGEAPLQIYRQDTPSIEKEGRLPAFIYIFLALALQLSALESNEHDQLYCHSNMKLQVCKKLWLSLKVASFVLFVLSSMFINQDELCIVQFCPLMSVNYVLC